MTFYDLILSRGVEGALLALEERVAQLEQQLTEPTPQPAILPVEVSEGEEENG